ncbi:MAG TPA: adenylate/guanylate cyclase domain-containing protein [Bauldia sp.]|nr:adenylate/guanylate cyclase domain-containing protein [Bauldia sp.]
MRTGIAARALGLASRIGSDPRDAHDIALQKRLVLVLTLMPAPAGLLWGIAYIIAGATLPGLIPTVYFFIALANTAAFAVTRNLALYRFSQLLLILLLPWLLGLGLGGFRDSSAVMVWSALCPLGALLLDSRRNAFYWLLAFVGLLGATALMQPWLPAGPLQPSFALWLFVLNIGAVISIAFVLLAYFVGQRDYFEQRAEALLLNILPKEISEALKDDDHGTIANHHDAASILFADVVEFTPMAATMSPLELVNLLNEVFQCFDALTEKYRLEKIKTIGDCYMVAAGVPRPRADHATAIVGLALDMQAAVAANPFCGRRLRFRIGVNSGPVVAGVIGRKKFIYDLWGDAVNLASRMESHGSAGAIQITRETYRLVKDEFVCEPKGVVRVKGAGELEVWHVLSRRQTAAIAPPEAALR